MKFLVTGCAKEKLEVIHSSPLNQGTRRFCTKFLPPPLLLKGFVLFSFVLHNSLVAQPAYPTNAVLATIKSIILEVPNAVGRHKKLINL